MTTKKLPLYLKNNPFSLYGNIGERMASGFLDGIILCPLTLGIVYFNSAHLYNYFYTCAVMSLIVAGYHIYLPVRYGATPGKRMMGLTILKDDGSAITYKESFLKYSPMIAIALLSLVFQTFAITNADAAVYDKMGWMEQSKYLQSCNPIPLWIQSVIIYGYYVFTLVLVAINDRHQSVSDQIAGTVVVYTSCLGKIAEYLEKGEETQE